MSYKIDSTFPAKLGDVTTITGLPLDTSASTFNRRLTRLFKKVFNGMSKFDDSYWKLLKDMISDPNDTFGLVAIDGYYTDVMGKDDLALVFNMGIPKLRGKRIKYLDRIYCRIATGNNLKFYNSFLDSDINDVHFEFDDRMVAWHPHISSGEPCLGSYSNDLAKWKAEGNPIMYLKSVHQFLNTWNVRSPFWNINNVIIDHVYGKKAFKSSKLTNAFSKVGRTHSKRSEQYVIDNISKIDTGSIAEDIWCLVSIYNKIYTTKRYLIDDFIESYDKEIINYMTKHTSIHSERDQIHDTIISDHTRIIIPQREEQHGIDTTTFHHSSIGRGTMNNNDEYEVKRIILDALSRIIYDLAKWIKTTSPIDDILKDDEYIMKMKCKYHFPLISRNNAHFDKMTESGLYDHRVLKYTSENCNTNTMYYSKKKVLIDRYEKRVNRLNALYIAYYSKQLNNESVTDVVNTKLRSFFNVRIDRNNPFIQRNPDKKEIVYYHLADKGRFWNNIGIYSTKGLFEDVNQFVEATKCWKDVSTLINAFETLKRELVLEEANSLINQYDKVIRRLREYGYKTSNTKKDSQQIHLSFE